MKRIGLILGTGAMALLLSSCFVMQGFTLRATSLNPGKSTKAVFTLHPYGTDSNSQYEFVLIGVENSNDLTVQGAKWGTNGKFGGPKAMSSEPSLDETLVSDGGCGSNGLDFGSITGMTWKGFMTTGKIRDRGQVDQKAAVEVGVKAIASAATGNQTVIGVSGSWADDGDHVIEAADTFYCGGIVVSNVYVNA